MGSNPTPGAFKAHFLLYLCIFFYFILLANTQIQAFLAKISLKLECGGWDLNPRTPTGQAPEATASLLLATLRLWPCSATPAVTEIHKKRFKSCCMLLNGNGEIECRLMVRFQRLEKLGHKLQKSRLLQRKDPVLGLKIGGIMRSG